MTIDEIEELIDAIDAKLAGPGSDKEKLSWPERAFSLACSFDDHVRSQDFTSFVFEQSPEGLRETVAALREVAADGYADVLGRFLSADLEAFSRQASLPVGSPEFEFSEDYDSALANSREEIGKQSETAYIERVLGNYAERAGLAQE